MTASALGQEQLLQAGDPQLTCQLEDILKTVDRQKRRAARPVKSILKKPDAQTPTTHDYKQLYLVYALDCKSSREHLLNGFEDQASAEKACVQWQEQHRLWYNGFNNYTLFVRGLFLNKTGPGGLTQDTLFTLSADWE